MGSLIETTIRAAQQRNVDVGLCGQMSGSTTFTMLLLGLGLRQMSVSPASILEIKKVCRSVTIEQCQAVARHALSLEHAREIKAYLKEELHKVAPELVT